MTFEKTVREIILKLSNRDSLRLSNFIDKKTGVYILEVIGVKETYEHFPTIGFTDSTYPNAPFYDNVKPSNIRYASLPTFDCRTSG